MKRLPVLLIFGFLFFFPVYANSQAEKAILDVAIGLIPRVEKICNKNKNLPKTILKGHVIMAVHSKNLSSIVSTGFKNMFETGKGAFYTGQGQKSYYKNRMAAENDLVCKDLGTKNPTLRPKYAFFMPDKNVGSQKAKMDPKYGDVFVVFKEDIKKRSTITMGDSLNNYSDNSDPRDPFRVRPHLKKPFGYVKSLTFYGAKLEKLSIDSDYYEVQIYGPLKINDVAEMRVKKSVYNKNKAFFQKVNVPIYEIKTGSYIYERGNKIEATGLLDR